MRLLTLVALACLACLPLSAQEPKIETGDAAIPVETADKPLNFWMQKKLDYSTAILQGLSLGDFELIARNARQMWMLNKVEGFVRNRNKDYRSNLQMFEQVTDDVVRQANDKNIDGVTLAFHRLTVSCVRCHQTLRAPDNVPKSADLPDIH